MPTSRRRRPPAVYRFTPIIQPLGTYAYAPKNYGSGLQAQPGALAGAAFSYHTQYVVTVNPIKEPPKPIVVSLSQPIGVPGWRRIVRTKMGTPYLQQGSMDKVFHAGHFVNVRAERDKMRGTYARGWTYSQPYPTTGPGARTISSGSSGASTGGFGGGAPRWVTKANG